MPITQKSLPGELHVDRTGVEPDNIDVTVEGRNQTLFTLSTFEKKSSKGRNFYCRASVMTKVNFD